MLIQPKDYLTLSLLGSFAAAGVVLIENTYMDGEEALFLRRLEMLPFFVVVKSRLGRTQLWSSTKINFEKRD
jgi:hypothetical protein